MKKKNVLFTEGPITGPLIRFAVPVFFAMVLQALYGAVDLLVVGKFGASTDVSAVSTGSQTMHMVTFLVTSFAMGMTVILGRLIGEGKKDDAGEVMGTGIVLFAVIGVAMSLLMAVGAGLVARMLNAPAEAFEETVSYIRICGIGMIVIVAYNLIGSIFRGIGDSTTPLITVAIACIFNIAGDLLLVAVFKMGTAGAALATVFAQLVSVVISLIMIRKQGLPFPFERSMLKLNGGIAKRIAGIGIPIALQELLVSFSFLVILAIVNGLGVVVSAGVGVAEKVCAFIMLVPQAFSQTMAASASQNIGAGKYGRARKSMWITVGISMVIGVIMFLVNFFRGGLLASIFTNDPEVISAAADYLRSYAIDCMLTAVMFNMTGFFNGLGMTRFTMIQGIVSAFCVRIPVSYFMSKVIPLSLFKIGLATPLSTSLQIILCMIALLSANRRFAKQSGGLDSGI